MAKEYSRAQRVADQIQKELAQLIQLEMKDPRLGMVTVSIVEVSRDMSFADIYVSFLGVDDQEQIDESLKVLNQASGFLRSQLARAVKLRFTPQLRFFFDNSLRRGAYLSSLIDQAVAKDGRSDKSSDEDSEE
ncbi:30S ribosome-binding factor RbfA [Endozoicomonas ascidiicola]|uniref:30S ribosome-binding factor RbfA n=1 Tax=Endozoicomonas ascidiicola TaxID=1698521 RepID=UPI000829AAFF|nr:30S ribosome-binding factor RbfA [Endozoicomonas ascidiicola]